ncbi:MAG TPA: beta-ketoacyl synthase N-terminal-like domain-containing protein [Polyangia bacterium]
MTSSPDIAVVGLGAATPIGRTALAAAAAVRAGISALAEHSFMVDSEGHPMRVAECPWLVEEANLAKRIVDCLLIAITGAITEGLDTIRAAGPRATTNLFVNLPSRRPGLPPTLVREVRDGSRQKFSGTFGHVEVMERGHAGSFVGLSAATKALRAGQAAACVVVGADSYIHPDMLEWLESTDQLHGAGPRNNAWGFIPGEGAGALLLVREDLAVRCGLPSWGMLGAVGVGRESKLIRTGTVCIGEGLTTAFKEALAALGPGEQVTDVYCDMNGEPYRADEYGFAVLRTRERFVSATNFFAPADCWGDVGAASGPLAILLACVAGHKRYATGGTNLIWGSSVDGDRGAALVRSLGRHS